MFCLNLITK